MMLFSLAAVCTALFTVSFGQSTFEPARPPAIPLAVKSPYFNSWQFAGSDDGNGGYLAGQWAQFWAGNTTGWTGLIRVDNSSYTWMGAPDVETTLVNQTAFEYTATKSIFTMDVAGLVEMNITFTSPLAPTDLKRQSLVFSYMNIFVSSLDGKAHSVQLYSDISAEWASGDPTSIVQWDYDVTDDGIAYHKVYRQVQQSLTEINQQAEWGYWWWSTSNSDGLTYQSGGDDDVRGAFVDNGVLANSKDTDYRAINDNYPVFGYANDLGTVSANSSASQLFSLGLTQETAGQLAGSDGLVSVPSLWTSYFSDDESAMAFFFNDYDDASGLSDTFDNQISTDSIDAAGQDYATITTLSARQAFAGTQLTGTTDKPYLFLKEISSDGDAQTVDVIFPFHPILLYSNPELVRYMLDPLFENQESGVYPNTYAEHDLGPYPNLTGYPQGNDEMQPLEECGNMLIMTLGYAQRTGDTAYLGSHYDKLTQWTGYLVEEALIPQNQISTDDFAGSLANQTNLALKGIIGIGAMAQIANLTGNMADAQNYTNISQSYITQWMGYGISTDGTHTTLAYGEDDTHGLLYNLYGDALLGLDLVPQSVYDMQSTFYPTQEATYGVPLDTRHTYTKSDWEMFVASIASDDTRAMFVSDLVKWINETPIGYPQTDWFDTITGDFNGGMFIARPVVGGHFALLALLAK